MTRRAPSLPGGSNARPLAVLVSAAAASLALMLDLDSMLRTVLVSPFLLVGPGLALVAPLRLDPVAELTLAVAVSLALAAVVASAMLYAGVWSPVAILLVLAGIAASAAALQLVGGTRGTLGARETGP